MKNVAILMLGILFLLSGCLPKEQSRKEKPSQRKDTRDWRKVSPKNILQAGSGLGKDKALIWMEPSIRKIDPQQPGRKVTPIWNGKEGEISLAKNEWESFQVVFRSLGKDLNLIPKIRFISGPSKRLSPSRFSLYSTMYISVKDPSSPLGHSGEYPDPLIPLTKPLMVTSKQNTLLWITLKSHKKDLAGQYKYSLDFYSQSKRVFQIPLKILLLNITLPDIPTLKAYYLFDTPSLLYKFHGVSGRKYEEILKEYTHLLLSYRMNPGNLDRLSSLDLRVQGNRVAMNFGKIDLWLTQVMAHSRVFSLPLPLEALSKHKPYKSKEFESLVRSTLRTLYKYYQQKGWIDKHFLFVQNVGGYTPKHISDEPYSLGKMGYDEVRYWSKLIHSAHPKLKFMVATPPYTQKGWGPIEGHIDIYNCYVTEVDDFTERTGELVRKGKEIFLVPNSFSDNLDYPGMFHRALGFFCMKHGLSGIEQWDVMGWYQYPGEPEPNPAKGILPLKWGAGAGALIYPGKNFGVDGPLGSIRLDLNRDAIEDYEYLSILAKKAGEEYSRQIAARLIPLGYTEMPLDEALFFQMKGFISREILRLKKGGIIPSLKSGKVVDSRGRPQRGVTVMGQYCSTLTNKKGRYSLYCPEGKTSVVAVSLIHRSNKSRVGSTIVLQEREAKTIFSFESSGEGYELSFEHTEGKSKTEKGRGSSSLSNKYATSGKKSLFVGIPKNYSCEIGFSGFPSNWEPYRFLAVDVYNPENYPLVVELSVSDKNGKAREVNRDLACPEKRQVALPGQKSTVIFALEELRVEGKMGNSFRPALDLSQINWFGFSLDNKMEAGPVTLYIDNVRLIK